MVVLGARVEQRGGGLSPALSVWTTAGTARFAITPDVLMMMGAGALFMRERLAACAVEEGGVLFEDQIRQTPVIVVSPNTNRR